MYHAQGYSWSPPRIPTTGTSTPTQSAVYSACDLSMALDGQVRFHWHSWAHAHVSSVTWHAQISSRSPHSVFFLHAKYLEWGKPVEANGRLRSLYAYQIGFGIWMYIHEYLYGMWTVVWEECWLHDQLLYVLGESDEFSCNFSSV